MNTNSTEEFGITEDSSQQTNLIRPKSSRLNHSVKLESGKEEALRIRLHQRLSKEPRRSGALIKDDEVLPAANLGTTQ